MAGEPLAGERCAACNSVRRGAEPHVPLDAVPAPVRAHLAAATGAVCAVCLASARMAEINERMKREHAELGGVERELVKDLARGRRATRHVDAMRDPTFGQRLADSVARVGGSWPFVAGAGVVIAVWMTINGLLSKEAFDPYPYILLNLVLSCLAALQAPIIMMSQNRASLRDRHAADLDFQVNLKAELEIEALHAKLDHLMQVRWEALLEMQDLQLQLLRTLENRVARDEAQAVQGPA